MPLPIAPPMIRPSASVASSVLRARHPDPQHDHRNRLDRHQDDLGELVVGLEPAKADPDIPGQHQVEERRDPDRAAMGEVEHVEQPELRGLIEHQRDDRGNDAGAEVRGSRAFEARHLSGLLFLLFCLGRRRLLARLLGGFLLGFAFLRRRLCSRLLGPLRCRRSFFGFGSLLGLGFLGYGFLGCGLLGFGLLGFGLLGFGLLAWASWLRLQRPSRLRQPSWPLRPSWP